ncbi:MAG: DNA methyltransferase, partial [bacterium]
MKAEHSRAVAGYLARVSRARKRGDATEHTYRAFLQELIEALAKGVTCTNEPKGSQQAGHPDLKVSLGETPLGFIETKAIGADLDAILDTSQLRRYLKNIPNFILTDYLEFRWYQNGSEVTRCRLGAFSGKGALRRNPDGEERLGELVENFAQAEVKSIGSPKELAQRMAALARLTRRHVLELFASEERKGDLHNLLRAFREVLLPDLDEESFADMYAQTVCYGLFAG